MHVSRAIAGYRGAGYWIGGALFAVLAYVMSAPVNAAESIISDVKNAGFGMDCGEKCRTYNVKWNAKHTGLPGGVTRYVYTGTVIPASRFRAAALTAARVGGRIYPALSVALMSAEYILNDDGEVTKEGPSNEGIVDAGIMNYSSPTSCGWSYGNPSRIYDSAAGAAAGMAMDSGEGYYAVYTSFSPNFGACGEMRIKIKNPDGNTTVSNYPITSGSGSLVNQPHFTPEGTQIPITDDDLIEIDMNLPPEIVEQVYNDSTPFPDWEDEISAIPFGENSVKSSGNAAPEVVKKTLKDLQNLVARYSGEDEPNTDTETDSGNSAEDEILEEIRDDTPPPPFEETKAEWDVEIIDALPSWSSGIGEGSCPAPWSFSMQGYTISWSYQPACDFATMMRPFVVGISFLIALYIVVGHSRGGTE